MSLPVLFGNNFLPGSWLERDEFLTPFSRFFDELTRKTSPEFYKELGDGFFEKGSYPKVDVRDEGSQIVIEAEVPGLKKEQVQIEVVEGILKIKGERRYKEDSKDSRYIYQELKRSSFCRTFVLGDNIDTGKIAAEFKDGVLNVFLPKLSPTKTKPEVKKIEIK